MDRIDTLKQTGVALYGPRWQTNLARDLNLSDARRVRQWVAGERRIPPHIWPEVGKLVAAKISNLETVKEELPC